MIANLEKGFVHECFPVAPDDELFAGKVPIDVPGSKVFYTPEEYSAHLRHIMEFSRKRSTYRFFALPEPPFQDVQIVISRRLVTVSRLAPPLVTILITHSALCGAFADYAERVKDQYALDKLSAYRLLEGHI